MTGRSRNAARRRWTPGPPGNPLSNQVEDEEMSSFPPLGFFPTTPAMAGTARATAKKVIFTILTMMLRLFPSTTVSYIRPLEALLTILRISRTKRR